MLQLSCGLVVSFFGPFGLISLQKIMVSSSIIALLIVESLAWS